MGDIVEQLREHRIAEGMSQHALARVLHVAPSLVSMREARKRTTSVDDAARTAEVFGLRLALVEDTEATEEAA